MSRRSIAAIVAVVTLVVISLTAVPAVGLSDEAVDDEPTPVPASFYGSVSIDGEPAPAGTELVAEIDGEERGSILVDDGGTYGGPGGFDEKLVVDGRSGDEGATISFRLDGEAADQTATWTEASTVELDLTLEGADESATRAGGTGSGTPGERSGSQESGAGDDDRNDANDDADGSEDSDGGADDDGDRRNGSVDEEQRVHGPEGDDQSDGANMSDRETVNDGDERADRVDSNTGDRADGLPGFGIPTSIVALLGTVHLVTRYRV